MLTAAVEHDEVKILDSISDKVMLAEGLTKENGIAPQAMQRGLDCIERFSQRIVEIPPQNIRIVGTNTLRAAKNANQYVEQLESILDKVEIDIVSGIEEARLIYLGVNHSWSSLNQLTSNLVIDIGGGSTEFIIGKNFKLKQAESLRMGCVAFRRFFPDNMISEDNFKQAYRAAKYEVAQIASQFKPSKYEYVVGSAGTLKAIEQILIANQLTDEGITLKGLNTLKRKLLEYTRMEDMQIEGLKPNRLCTIVPGIAITLAIFKTLDIKQLHISRGGLREGILYDLLGRHKKEDVRERSINAIKKRYRIAEEHARILKRVTNKLVSNYTSKLRFTGDDHLKFLRWAVQCARIGLAINHSQYQTHSAYLIKHSELSGFSIKERVILSAIILNHRRKINLEIFDTIQLTPDEKTEIIQIVFVVRLVMLIAQNGKTNQCEDLRLFFKKSQFYIETSKHWLADHPLLAHAFQLEKKYWKKAGIELNIDHRPI
ncbi:Ppx/GppA phosphatase family protein [Aliikangiella maris]|uniref:Ppx/GppA phosphatase family protein n=3 Tax=Aliikangiella maris TaxID=3162458 RepID=A0ABV2BTR4_9GAMM